MINETATTLRIQAYSLRGLLLGVQEYIQQGWVVDSDKEAINMINVHVCHMTKLSVAENNLVDWHVQDTTPIIVDIIEEDVVPTEEKRKPGRPPKETK